MDEFGLDEDEDEASTDDEAEAETGADDLPPPRPSVRDILRTAGGLEALILLAHLAGVMMYKVDDLPTVGLSILGFSAIIGVGALMVLGGHILDAVLGWFAPTPPPEAKPARTPRGPWADD